MNTTGFRKRKKASVTRQSEKRERMKESRAGVNWLESKTKALVFSALIISLPAEVSES